MTAQALDLDSKGAPPGALLPVVVCEARATRLPRALDVFEVSIRRRSNNRVEPVTLTSSAQVAELLTPHLAGLSKEEMWAVYLDAKNAVLGSHMISRGTLTQSLVHPREAFRPAVWLGADAVIFAHNHPTGNPAPSLEDFEITERLMEAGHVLGIRVLDHIIVGDASRGHVSLRERGCLDD